jgi:hypothetical protein
MTQSRLDVGDPRSQLHDFSKTTVANNEITIEPMIPKRLEKKRSIDSFLRLKPRGGSGQMRFRR